MIALLILAAFLFAWLRYRSVRKNNLAGLNGERPVFSVEPPSRRLGSRKGERL